MEQEKLFKAAWRAREKAYAPYSKFSVGAALLAPDGQVFAGCNVENISFGLTNCAERVALGSAVAAGVKEFRLLVVVSDSAEPVVPCGACRQVLSEFSPSLKVLSSTWNGEIAEWNLETLLPSPRQGILK